MSKESNQPVVTVFCSFTRRWALDRWLSNLLFTNLQPSLTNLAFIVDTDEPEIRIKLKQFAQRHGYRDWRISMNNDHFVNEVRISARRLRIADMKNESKELIKQLDGDYVIGLEDDTVFEGADLLKLVKPLTTDDEIGFVEGVQCGRWGVKMIGAWQVDDVENPKQAKTILPDPNVELTEIDGGGFYGYATTKELYITHDYHWREPMPYGPDIVFGLWLRQNGYRCFIDWTLKFGHDDHGRILYPDEGLTQIVYNKDENNNWIRSDKTPNENPISNRNK